VMTGVTGTAKHGKHCLRHTLPSARCGSSNHETSQFGSSENLVHMGIWTLKLEGPQKAFGKVTG
jgi:hypothetical protein